jgi:hypothetical protein
VWKRPVVCKRPVRLATRNRPCACAASPYDRRARGARTGFRYGSAQVEAASMKVQEPPVKACTSTPCRSLSRLSSHKGCRAARHRRIKTAV